MSTTSIGKNPLFGTLAFQYATSNGRSSLTSITITKLESSQAIEVPLTNIWVNEQPAASIKQFRWHVIPTDFKFTKTNERYLLSCKPEDLGLVAITYTCSGLLEGSHTEDVFPSLNVKGLKSYFQNKLNLKELFIFYEGLELNNESTIDECGIEDVGRKGTKIIEIRDSKVAAAHNFNLQLYTGGECADIPQFKAYIDTISKKIDLVCQIKITFSYGERFAGTGLLIAQNMIMTNEHVLSKKTLDTCEKIEAIFFFDDEKSERVTIPLLQEKKLDIVASSTRKLPSFEHPSKDHLDYLIIRFPEGWFRNLKNSYKICSLAHLAKEFFSPPNETIDQRKNRLNSWKKDHANIIQHPEGKNKHIAFRDNKIVQLEQFLLHYKSSTKEGSSGSPVSTDSGVFMGLHASACPKLESALFQNLQLLLKELPLGFEDTEKYKDAVRYCFKETNLQVFFDGQHKGSCTENGETFSLIELIAKKGVKKNGEGEIDPQIHPRAWGYHFLIKSGIKLDFDENHIYCNTAIVADDIFRSIPDEKFTEIKKAQTAPPLVAPPLSIRLKQFAFSIIKNPTAQHVTYGAIALIALIAFRKYAYPKIRSAP